MSLEIFGNIYRHFWFSQLGESATNNQWEEARDADKHPTMHRIAHPHPHSYPATPYPHSYPQQRIIQPKMSVLPRLKTEINHLQIN